MDTVRGLDGKGAVSGQPSGSRDHVYFVLGQERGHSLAQLFDGLVLPFHDIGKGHLGHSDHAWQFIEKVEDQVIVHKRIPAALGCIDGQMRSEFVHFFSWLPPTVFWQIDNKGWDFLSSDCQEGARQVCRMK